MSVESMNCHEVVSHQINHLAFQTKEFTNPFRFGWFLRARCFGWKTKITWQSLGRKNQWLPSDPKTHGNMKESCAFASYLILFIRDSSQPRKKPSDTFHWILVANRDPALFHGLWNNPQIPGEHFIPKKYPTNNRLDPYFPFLNWILASPQWDLHPQWRHPISQHCAAPRRQKAAVGWRALESSFVGGFRPYDWVYFWVWKDWPFGWKCVISKKNWDKNDIK